MSAAPHDQKRPVNVIGTTAHVMRIWKDREVEESG